MRNGCVAAFSNDRLIGFMGISLFFPFKGMPAALINELSHASAVEEKGRIYQELYRSLGEILREKGVQLHIIAHGAGDTTLEALLYRLGFGAFLAEELREVTRIGCSPEVPVEELTDFRDIIDLESEHRRYYSSSPIFLRKDLRREIVERDLLEMQSEKCTVLVHRAAGRPAAYFVVGLCKGLEEGRLLRDSNSAQILSAYATPSARGKGVGAALLDRCITWGRAQGFERLMVEHETANLLGSSFWARFFRPYLTFSLRFVDRVV
jgi:GNAT superfamily N-acetyltransferase